MCVDGLCPVGSGRNEPIMPEGNEALSFEQAQVDF